MAFFMIMAYFYLGTSVIVTDDQVPMGALALGYATSSLAGYFNLGQSPLAQLTRVNGVSVLNALIGLGSILNGGGCMAIWLLTMLHMYDTLMGVSQEVVREEDHYEILPTSSSNYGPIMSFFTESWRTDSINK